LSEAFIANAGSIELALVYDPRALPRGSSLALRLSIGSLVAIAIGLVPTTLPAGPAPGSTSSGSENTAQVDLVNKDGMGIKGVKAQCTLIVGFDGSLTVRCRFKNTSKRAKRFVVCMMLDLQEDKAVMTPRAGAERYVIEQVPVSGVSTLRCRKVSGPVGPESSYHLGCKLVTVGAGKTVEQEWKGTGSYSAPPGKRVGAFDFEVSYADTVDLSAEPGKPFDEASCNGVVGQGQFLVPAGGTRAAAVWVLKHTPFKDPFVAYQRSAGIAPASRQYVLYADLPCSPSELPERSPPAIRCPRRAGPPPPYFADLNLFWFGSMGAAPGTRFPGTLRITTTGNRSGLRVVTRPRAGRVFVMPGGGSLYGRIGVCAARVRTRCLAPSVAEGRTLGVRVTVRNRRGRILFEEQGDFIEDTRPPFVQRLSAARRPDGSVAFTVTARDRTTSPIAAAVFYSLDGGETWGGRRLVATTNLLARRRVRTFTGSVLVREEVPPDAFKYYVTVQDELDNVVWFGPARPT
jgi:hypothetical protein